MKTSKSSLIPSRVPGRAHLDKETIFPICDEALYCTISYSANDLPFSIPSAMVRIDEHLYIHGSAGSHFLMEIAKGKPVCITITLMDGLVVAKSAVHYSVNYRSVIIFSAAEKVDSPELKMKHLNS